MAFTFHNYQPSKNAEFGDLISNILGGYKETSKAKFLQPKLQEELKKSQLYNKWYEPNMQSQIGLRGAQTGQANAHTGLLGEQTRGASIHNQYLPRQLQEELIKAHLYNQFYAPDKQSEIGLRNEQARGVGIQNQYLPQTLENDLATSNFKRQNPLLGMTGGAGQVGALMYLQQHPELSQNNSMGNAPQEPQSYIPSISNNPNNQRNESPNNANNEYDLLQKSILASLQPKTAANKVSPLETAQDYAHRQAQQYGADSKEAKIANDYVDKVAHGTQTKKDVSLMKHREHQDNIALWKSLPAPAKSYAIAIGQGAGFSGDETAKWLASGKSMKDLLFQHGINDESEVEPVYQLTGSAQTQLLQRQFASKEADYLSKFITDATGDYARTVAGYSPKLIQEQLAGKNEEQQARMLAARGLAPELINLRLVLANAKSTVSAQNQLRDKAMLDLKNFRTLTTPKVWTRMQQIMDSELQNMFKHAKTGFGQKVSSALTKDKAKDNDPAGIL